MRGPGPVTSEWNVIPARSSHEIREQGSVWPRCRGDTPNPRSAAIRPPDGWGVIGDDQAGNIRRHLPRPRPPPVERRGRVARRSGARGSMRPTLNGASRRHRREGRYGRSRGTGCPSGGHFGSPAMCGPGTAARNSGRSEGSSALRPRPALSCASSRPAVAGRKPGRAEACRQARSPGRAVPTGRGDSSAPVATRPPPDRAEGTDGVDLREVVTPRFGRTSVFSAGASRSMSSAWTRT